MTGRFCYPERLDHELRNTAARFMRAVLATNDGIWDWDLRHGTLYLSRRCAEIVGTADDGGKQFAPGDWWELTHPHDRHVLLRALEAHIANTEPALEIEQRIQRPDGQCLWLLLRGRLLRDEDGMARHLTGSVSDISERKRAEGELRRQKEKLADVGRMNVMQELAAGLAHDLNQPLAAITNYAKGTMLRMQSGNVDPGEIGEGLERIATQALRAGEIVRRMRNLMRHAGASAESIQVNDLVRSTVTLLHSETPPGSCSVRVEAREGLPLITGDPIQLQQVLINLLRNACEAIPPASPASEVVIHTMLHGTDFVEIAVSDSGTGLPAEQREKIFDPFFTTKPRKLGVGLSISRSIAEAHGGRLWATPNTTRGATFHLCLPIHQPVQS